MTPLKRQSTFDTSVTADNFGKQCVDKEEIFPSIMPSSLFQIVQMLKVFHPYVLNKRSKYSISGEGLVKQVKSVKFDRSFRDLGHWYHEDVLTYFLIYSFVDIYTFKHTDWLTFENIFA